MVVDSVTVGRGGVVVGVYQGLVVGGLRVGYPEVVVVVVESGLFFNFLMTFDVSFKYSSVVSRRS